MSYLVLARKWRPMTFDDLVGQEHVSRTLSNAINSERIAHAFLFTGVRGVGKTTSARILAKSLNCEKGPTPHPCLECDACREIAEGTDLDVQEIDGASYNGVDEVRRLQESLPYRPSRDRYKVVIVDEVHMLSNNAWNAFLKTLEEPPPHVKFIFATTEVHKVPVTILSRVQRYDFKLISNALIAKRMRYVLEQEHITADEAAIALMAREAEGSMRDAMSMLDQAIAWGGKDLRGEEISRVLGIAGRAVLHDLARAVVKGQADECLSLVGRLADQGFDITQVARDTLEHLRDVVVVKVSKKLDGVVELTSDELERVRQLAAETSAQDLLRVHLGFSQGFDQVVRAPQQRTALEMLLVRLALRPPLLPVDDLIARLGNLERRLGAKGARPRLPAERRPPAQQPRPADPVPARATPQPTDTPRVTSSVDAQKPSTAKLEPAPRPEPSPRPVAPAGPKSTVSGAPTEQLGPAQTAPPVVQQPPAAPDERVHGQRPVSAAATKEIQKESPASAPATTVEHNEQVKDSAPNRATYTTGEKTPATSADAVSPVAEPPKKAVEPAPKTPPDPVQPAESQAAAAEFSSDVAKQGGTQAESSPKADVNPAPEVSQAESAPKADVEQPREKQSDRVETEVHPSESAQSTASTSKNAPPSVYSDDQHELYDELSEVASWDESGAPSAERAPSPKDAPRESPVVSADGADTGRSVHGEAGDGDEREPGGDNSAQALPEVSEDVRARWRQIVDEMMKKNGALGAVLAQAFPMEVSERVVRFGIEAGSFYERQARTERARVLMDEVIGQVVTNGVKIVVERVARRAPGQQGPMTVYEELEQEERLENARKRKVVEKHPLVRAAIDELGAEILRIKFPEK